MTSGLEVAHAVNAAADSAVRSFLMALSDGTMHRQRAALDGSGPHPDGRRARAREIPGKELWTRRRSV